MSNTATLKKELTINQLVAAVHDIQRIANDDFSRKMDEEIENEITLELVQRSKFSKIVYDDAQNHNPIFGFIAMTDTRDYKRGDLFSAINANEPDLTESVGNIFALEDAEISWTGL
jgi:hypothetical protein